MQWKATEMYQIKGDLGLYSEKISLITVQKTNQKGTEWIGVGQDQEATVVNVSKMPIVQTRVVMDNEKKQMESKDKQILPKDLHSQVEIPKTGSIKNISRTLINIAKLPCGEQLQVNCLVSVPLSEFLNPFKIPFK